MNNKILLPILFFFGIIFRIILPGNFSVGFDQVQILSHADQIIHGNFSLIGPRTGPADMFTGPLIYYLSVPFVLVFGDYLAVSLVPLFISIITGVGIFWLINKYLSKNDALIALTIWSFSPFLISLDRVFWNPNLTLLAAFLLFTPLLNKKSDKISHLFLFFGAFLSYQAHFTGFFLILLSILSIITLRKSSKFVFSIIGGILLSLLPTVIFDFRNNFLNFKGLIGLVQDKGTSSLLSLLQDLIHNVYILAETFGKLFLYGNSAQTIIVLGTTLFVVSVFLLRKSMQFKLAMLWLLSIAVAFSFYGGQKPEYYFLISIPPLFLLSTKLIGRISPGYKKLLLLFFLANSILINIKMINSNSGMNVGNIAELDASLNNTKVKSIIYDVPYGTEVGLKYFLSDIELTDDGDDYHVSYPNNLTFKGVEKFSDIGLWKDLRSNDKNYVSKNSYFIGTQKNYYLYENLYPKNSSQDFDAYKIIENNLIVGSLYVAPERNEKLDWVKNCHVKKDQGDYNWALNDSGQYSQYNSGYCLLITPTDGYQLDPNMVSFW